MIDPLEEHDCTQITEIEHPLGFICIGLHEEDVRLCLRRDVLGKDVDSATMIFSCSIEKIGEIIEALGKVISVYPYKQKPF